MRRFARKFVAVFTVLALLGGAPTYFGGDVFKAGIEAEAAEQKHDDTITPAVGVTAYVGDAFKSFNPITDEIYYFHDYNNGGHKYSPDDIKIEFYSYYYLEEKDCWKIGQVHLGYPIIVKCDKNRKLEIPIGVKVVKGTGTEADPFYLEAIYSDTSIVPETVIVGKKWLIGDLLNTDAYFKFNYYYSNETIAHDWHSEEHIGRFFKTKLPELEITESSEFTTFPYDFYFVGVIADSDSGKAYDLQFVGTPENVTGIEITGGSGTKNDPFTIAPIMDEPFDPGEGVWGDASGDGEVKMNDVVLIMQSLSNADKYGLNGSDDTHITRKGQYWADVESNGNGVTPKDALQIQKYLVQLVDSLEPKTE